MKVLALDIATTTGFTYNPTDAVTSLTLGSLKLASSIEVATWGKLRMDRRCDPRVERLFVRLQEMTACQVDPDVIVFEDVQFQSYTKQCQLWAALRAAVWLAGSRAKSQPIFECVPVSTLKKFATGHGGATKEMMCSAMIRQGGGTPGRFRPGKKLDTVLDTWNGIELDDNAVDAFHLWQWAKLNLGRITR